MRLKRQRPFQRGAVVLLAGLNLLLLIALILSIATLPRAVAQPRRTAGEFVAVTAKVSARPHDALYVLDTSEHLLYAFYPTRVGGSQLNWSPPRDLRKDFENK